MIAPKPIVTAAAGPVAIAKAQQLSNREIVDRANAYFTGISTLRRISRKWAAMDAALAGRSISSVPASSASNSIRPRRSK